MRPKRKVTEDQKTKLLEMVRLDRWTVARFKDPAYHAQKVRWWNKAGAILNSIHGGALKTPKQWEKTFKDLRLAVKKKEVAYRSNAEVSSDNPDGMTKESFHQKMLELMENEIDADDGIAVMNDEPAGDSYNGDHSTNENLDECRAFLQSKIAGLERIAKAQEDLLASDRRNAASFEKLINAFTRYLDRHS